MVVEPLRSEDLWEVKSRLERGLWGSGHTKRWASCPTVYPYCGALPITGPKSTRSTGRNLPNCRPKYMSPLRQLIWRRYLLQYQNADECGVHKGEESCGTLAQVENSRRTTTSVPESNVVWPDCQPTCRPRSRNFIHILKTWGKDSALGSAEEAMERRPMSAVNPL